MRRTCQQGEEASNKFCHTPWQPGRQRYATISQESWYQRRTAMLLVDRNTLSLAGELKRPDVTSPARDVVGCRVRDPTKQD